MTVVLKPKPVRLACVGKHPRKTAPVVVHVVAPGFESNGERFPLAVTFVRLSVPYVALSGIVAPARVGGLDARRG